MIFKKTRSGKSCKEQPRMMQFLQIIIILIIKFMCNSTGKNNYHVVIFSCPVQRGNRDIVSHVIVFQITIRFKSE